MRSAIYATTTMLVLGAFCATASAYSLTDTGSTSFTSDLAQPGLISVDSFDTTKGTLQGITIELWHAGQATMRADNDDPFNSAQVQARLIRIWSLTGPDITASGNKTIMSPVQLLGLDDGDGGVFDSSAGDGHDFGYLSYSFAAGTYTPTNLALYETAGPGTVTFTVTPDTMVNDLNWVGDAPDVWQMEVQDPNLVVSATVTYTYMPEPATMGLMLLGALAMRRKRHA